MTDTQSTALAIVNETPELPALLKTPADCEAFYSGLDASVANEARQAAAKIRDHIGRSIHARIDAGRELIVIKEKLEHGQFGKWIAAEFGLTDKSAQNYMNAAKLADKNPKLISDLPSNVVYKLAAPSTPQAVIDEIETRINKGEALSVKEINDRIYIAKQKEVKAERLANEAQVAADRRAARRARADANKTPEEIEKANKRRAAADKKREEANQRKIEAAARERQEKIDNAHKAVEFLRNHLGDRFAEFHKIIANSNISEFERALQNAPAAKVAAPVSEPANDPGVKGRVIIEELDLKEDLVEDLDLPDAA